MVHQTGTNILKLPVVICAGLEVDLKMAGLFLEWYVQRFVKTSSVLIRAIVENVSSLASVFVCATVYLKADETKGKLMQLLPHSSCSHIAVMLGII